MRRTFSLAAQRIAETGAVAAIMRSGAVEVAEPLILGPPPKPGGPESGNPDPVLCIAFSTLKASGKLLAVCGALLSVVVV